MKLALVPCGIAVALMWLLLAGPAHARDWNLPQDCTNDATGDEDDTTPVVEVYRTRAKNIELLNNAVREVTFVDGVGYANLFIVNDPLSQYLLTVSFTPFLDAYTALLLNHSGAQVIRLPPAGEKLNAQQKLMRSVTVTIKDQNGQNVLRGASVIFAPNFIGSDPYFMQSSDTDGTIVINCLLTRPEGNPVFIVPKGTTAGFDTTINFSGATTPGPTTKAAKSSKKSAQPRVLDGTAVTAPATRQ
jgi:hypothetical protein